MSVSKLSNRQRLELRNLEDRTTPAVSTTFSAGVLTFTGDGANDKVVLEATTVASTVVYDYTGNLSPSGLTQSGVTQVIFHGMGGDDQLLISNNCTTTNQVFAPSSGITFNGGSDAGDNIRLVGGKTSAFSTGTYNATGNNGSLSHVTTLGTINVTFTGVPTVVDTTITGGAMTTTSSTGNETVTITPNGVVAPITTITQGPVFVDGGDRDDHGSFSGGNNLNGWKFIEQAVQFARNGSFNTGTVKDVLVVGVTGATTQARLAINSVLAKLGYTADFVSGAAISSVDFKNYKAIYVPSHNVHTIGGISDSDITLLNGRRLDVGMLIGISNYVKSGGGIVALTEADATNPYGWLQLPAPFTITESFSGSTTTMVQTPALAAAGFNITNTELTNGTPVHNRFTGPLGPLDENSNPTFNGLKVLVKNNLATEYIVLGQGALNTSYGDAVTSTRITGSTLNTLILGNKGSLVVNTVGGDDTITIDGSGTPVQTLAGPLTINAGSNVGDTLTINTTAGAALTGTITDSAGNLSIAGYAPTAINVTPSISTLTLVNKGGDATTIVSYPAAFAVPNLILDNTTGSASAVSLAASNLINNATTVTVRGNATFDIGANSDTISRLVLDGGNVTGTTGVLTSTNTIFAYSGSASAILASANGLTKSTTGTATLSGPNTYTGTTTISAGTLSLANGAAIIDNGPVVLNNGTLNLVNSETIGSLSGAAGTSVTLNANTLTTGGNNASTTYSGSISGATGSLIKMGNGVFTLDGTNTYSSLATGTTEVMVGTLLVNGTNSGTGPVNIASGATLGGTGLIAGQVNAPSGATISPGSPVGTTADLGIGNLNMAPGSTYTVQLNGQTPNTEHDQLAVTGTVTLGTPDTDTPNPFLTFTGTVTPALGQTFKIIDNDGVDPVVGNFDQLLQGAAIYNFLGSPLTAHINYFAGDGNDVHISLKVVEVMPNGDVHVYGHAGNNEFRYDPDVTIPGNVRIILDGIYYGSYPVPAGNVLRTFGGDGIDTVRILGSTGDDTFTVDPDVLRDSLRDKIFSFNGIPYTSHLAESYTLLGGDGNDTFYVQGLGINSMPQQRTNVSLEGGNGDDILDTTALLTTDVAGHTTAGIDVLVQGPQRGIIENVLKFNTMQAYVGGALDENVTFLSGGSMPGSTLGYLPVIPAFQLGTGNDLFDLRGQLSAVTIRGQVDGMLIMAVGNTVGAETVIGTNSTTPDILMGADQPNVFDVTGTNSGTYTSGTNPLVNFQSLESIVGGSDSDLVQMQPAGSLGGSIDGALGSDEINYSTRSTNVATNVATAKTTSVTGTWVNVESVVAGTGTNTLTGAAVASVWTLTDVNDGTLNGLSFTDYSTLLGGTAADVFVLGASGSAVSINGGTGTDTLSYAGDATGVAVNLTTTVNGSGTRIPAFVSIERHIGGSGLDTLTGTPSGDTIVVNAPYAGTINTTTGFSGYENLVGAGGNDKYTVTTAALMPLANLNAGLGNDSLTGPNATSTFILTSLGTGTLNGMPFTGVETLTGGTGVDTFDFSAGGSVTGPVNGGLNLDTLIVAGNVNLATKVATGIGGLVTNFESYVSSTGGTLTGTNTTNTWRLTGLDVGTLNSSISFSGFANINGGTAADRLLFLTGGLSGTFNAGGGTDTVDYQTVTTIVRPYTPTVTGLVSVIDGLGGLTQIDGFELLANNL